MTPTLVAFFVRGYIKTLELIFMLIYDFVGFIILEFQTLLSIMIFGLLNYYYFRMNLESFNCLALLLKWGVAQYIQIYISTIFVILNIYN